MNDDQANLPSGDVSATSRLASDDPIFALADDFYALLRSDATPETALTCGVAILAKLFESVDIADEQHEAWAWVLAPVLDLPVGWSSGAADPEGVALAVEHFAEEFTPKVISVPAASTFLAVPVIVRDDDKREIVAAMIALPLKPDVLGAENIYAGAATGASLISVQLENTHRTRMTERSLQFSQAAAAIQQALIEPATLREALTTATDRLSSCEALHCGRASVFENDRLTEVASFGGECPADEDSELRVTLPIVIDEVAEAEIQLGARHVLNVAERETLSGISSVISGSVIRRRSAETIGELRRSATRRLVDAQERERSMIAADIHDGVLQQLGATAIRLELAQSRMEQNDYGAARSIISDGADEIRACARELRGLLMELRPQVLDDNGLNAALVELGHHVAGTQVTVDSQLPDELGSEFAITIFRIVQEGLTNVEKHAQADSAEVRVAVVDGSIEVVIEDDGIGYEGSLSGPSSEGSHFGLLGMRERAQMFGGSFSVTGSSGRGTRIRAVLPLNGTIRAGD